MERKLAAILSADVKGYSLLMGEDEATTIRTLTAYREVQDAIGLMQTAMRLNPHYPFRYLWDIGHAYYLTRQYAEAMAALTNVLVRNPDWLPAHFYLAATYSELGWKEEARASLAKFLRLGPQPSGAVLPSTEPAVAERLHQARHRAEEILPYRDPAILERLLQAWRRAMVSV